MITDDRGVWDSNIQETWEMQGKPLNEQQHKLVLVPANKIDYMKWLEGYLERGGKITHVYNYPFSTQRWYLAKQYMKPMSFYGAKSFNIIIPKGIHLERDGWGHCDLFFMDDFSVVGGVVSVFQDINFF